MHNRIFIEEDKEFTLDEFASLLSVAIKTVTDTEINEDTRYRGEDIYACIDAVLGYINERVHGDQFRLKQTDPNTYVVVYIPSEDSNS